MLVEGGKVSSYGKISLLKFSVMTGNILHVS